MASARRRHNAGFTYVGLIIIVAIIGLVSATTIKLGSLLQRRAAEEQLLEVGTAFADALKSYADASLPGQSKQPTSVAELLRDPRFPNARRHLRQLYLDPITGGSEWGIMRTNDKVGIIGFYSLSTATPIKQSNFQERFQQFDHMQRLSDWKFMGTGLQDLRFVPPPLPVRPDGTVPPPPSENAGAALEMMPAQPPQAATAPAAAGDPPPEAPVEPKPAADVTPPAEPPPPEVAPGTREEPPAAAGDDASQPPGAPKAVKKR
ncbi:MAG: type II secretion system protein [Pseudomonadota bacterium]